MGSLVQVEGEDVAVLDGDQRVDAILLARSRGQACRHFGSISKPRAWMPNLRAAVTGIRPSPQPRSQRTSSPLEPGEIQQRLYRFLRCRLIQNVGDAFACPARPQIDRFEVPRPNVDAAGDGLRTITAGHNRLDDVGVLARRQRRRLETSRRAGRFGVPCRQGTAGRPPAGGFRG